MMPGYGSMLKDPAVADLVTYMRQAFGGVSGDITPDQVKAQRAKP
jgi:mono/diheme cytochrome c family protein